MKYFKEIASGLDPLPALRELEASPDLWGLIDVRQKFEGTAHAHTETIVLRGPDRLDGVMDNLDALDFEALTELPAVAGYLKGIVRTLGAREIGRVMAVKLLAGQDVAEHVDEGAYARFHAPLASTPACVFNCGDELVHMAPGSLWWFDHQAKHSVVNRGPDRIHLILDVTAPGWTGALH